VFELSQSPGMFSYVQDDLPDEEFEVINFWVE
jgi:hypothetical protein